MPLTPLWKEALLLLIYNPSLTAYMGRGRILAHTKEQDLMDWRLAAAAISCIALLATSVFVQRDMGSVNIIQRFAYAMFPVSQLLVSAVLLVWIIQLGLSDEMLAVVCLATIVCCPIDVALFRKLKQAQDREFAEARERLLSEQLKIQKRYNAKLQEEMTNIGYIRAKAEREFAKAAALITRNPSCDVEKAFESVQAAMGDEMLRYCDNAVVDVIADVKNVDCKRAEVKASFALDVPRHTTSISDVELCAVFSNLLDNALEAAKRSAKDGFPVPFVEIESKVRGNTLTVSTKNSMPRDLFHDGVSNQNKKLKARKPFKSIEARGWGLSIVEEIALRHNGVLVTSVDDGTFKASVMLVFEEECKEQEQ